MENPHRVEHVETRVRLDVPLPCNLFSNIDSSLGPNIKVYLSNRIWTREREKAVDLEDDKSLRSENKFPSSKIHTELNSIFCGYIRLYIPLPIHVSLQKLWLFYTAWDRDWDWDMNGYTDRYNRKQWFPTLSRFLVSVPVPILASVHGPWWR